jgi:hypothetical protein
MNRNDFAYPNAINCSKSAVEIKSSVVTLEEVDDLAKIKSHLTNTRYTDDYTILASARQPKTRKELTEND